MSIDILKEELKNNKLRNLYLFYGPEEYLEKYYIESIEKIALVDDMRELNRIVLEGKVDVRKIIEHSETMPVFSQKKVVIVKNAGLAKGKKKAEEEGKGKAHSDDLLSYLQNVPDYTCLIVLEQEIDKRVKIVDIAKKKGLLVEFPYQKPAELVKWVIKVFKSHKKEIDSLVASKIVDNSELGMTEILNEINKIVLFLGDKSKPTAEDIDKICSKSVKSRIFDLTDAIAEKNGAKALRILNDMLVIKEPLPKILFMITRQFRQVLEMKLLRQNGMDMNQAAGKIGITPYAAGKIAKQAGVFSIEQLKNAIEDSLQTDLAIKTGRMNDRIAVELLITKYAG